MRVFLQLSFSKIQNQHHGIILVLKEKFDNKLENNSEDFDPALIPYLKAHCAAPIAALFTDGLILYSKMLDKIVKLMSVNSVLTHW